MTHTTRRQYAKASPLAAARRKLGHDAYAFILRQEINLIKPDASLSELRAGDRATIKARVARIAEDWS